MAKRALEDWLSSFLEWTTPRSESPISMLEWAGLFTLSSIVKKRVFWSRRLLGGYEIYPALYVIFVANPGVARKSTTVGFGESLMSSNLLTGPNCINFAPDVTSHSKLLAALADSHDGSIAVVADEFSNLIQTTPEPMYEILTTLFDHKKSRRWGTWAHGDKVIENPTLTLFAATTPAWIASQPPSYFVGGGFASRVIFVYEETPRQREIFYDHLDPKEIEDLGKKLESDLPLIASLKGEFSFASTKVKEEVRDWYKSQVDDFNDARLQGFRARKHVHALKVAGLLSASERPDLIVTSQHFQKAISLLDYVETRMSRAFSTLGSSPFSILMDDVFKYVQKKGAATLSDVAAHFYTDGLTLEQLRGALAYLCTTGKLQSKGSVINPIYDSR